MFCAVNISGVSRNHGPPSLMPIFNDSSFLYSRLVVSSILACFFADIFESFVSQLY